MANSACEQGRGWIESHVPVGCDSQNIYEDLVERHGFTHRCNSVSDFVHRLRAREPTRFDVLEFLPGEEAEVDHGQGALTQKANGKYGRPYLFVMTLSTWSVLSQGDLENEPRNLGATTLTWPPGIDLETLKKTPGSS